MSAETVARLSLPVGDRDHSQGALDAPVTFVEYGDYECPHCLQAHSIVKEIQERLGDRFRYVYRHFPLRMHHPHAEHAAEAAEAAGAQGKFWEMHDALFEHQGSLSDERLVEYADELGLDVERFKRALAGHHFADRVHEDFRSGVQSGANGTPTFYINGERYDGPWDVESLLEEIERPLGIQVRNLFQRFTRMQASGAILLLISSVLALIFANSGAAHDYLRFWETSLTFSLGDLSLSEHLAGWVNDGLMVLFFFVVGLEIKREITIGELSSPRQAALPIVAAIGGMALPALIFAFINIGTDEVVGWAVPMATDIAFTLGLLALLGRRVPLSLRVFFTALAIADDLGAVLVIAFFYTSEIVSSGLILGAAILLALVALNRLGVRRPLPYMLLGAGLWLATLESGVHPTIAGVLLALTIPTKTRVRAQAFMAQCTALLGGLDRPAGDESEQVDLSDRQQTAAHTLEAIAERMQTPAHRLEHSLTPWAIFLVLPLFALANAGVALSVAAGMGIASRLSLGIILGLAVGKPLGISSFAWLAVKLKIAELPPRVEWPQLFAASWLAGIGFTMALFIANTAFTDTSQLAAAKVSILIGSLFSGLIGFSLLLLTSRMRDRRSELIPTAVD